MKLTFQKPERSADWLSLLDKYRKIANKNSNVLEIGASTQLRTKQLALSCNKLIGIDIFQDRLPINFDNISYKHLSWTELSTQISCNSIDIAISSHVIEHVHDDLLAINQLYDVLKDGGVAILTTPNRKRLTRSLIELFSKERQFPYWEHVREYIEADLISLLERSKI